MSDHAVTHTDGIGDTGEGYIARKGWSFQCLWCTRVFFANTKAEAESQYRRHEREMFRREGLCAHDGVES